MSLLSSEILQVNWYREEHEIESVSGVLGVQGLKQGGNYELRVLPFSTVITKFRLGELNPILVLLNC